MYVARQPSEDAAPNANDSVPKPKSRGPLRSRRCRRVVVGVVSCSWELKDVLSSDRFALEDPSTKLSMMSFPCPPAPDGLPYVSEWAAYNRAIMNGSDSARLYGCNQSG